MLAGAAKPMQGQGLLLRWEAPYRRRRRTTLRPDEVAEVEKTTPPEEVVGVRMRAATGGEVAGVLIVATGVSALDRPSKVGPAVARVTPPLLRRARTIEEAGRRLRALVPLQLQ